MVDSNNNLYMHWGVNMKNGKKAASCSSCFFNEERARNYLERVLWPDGPVCPHCGGMGKAYRMKGKTARAGLWKCSYCRQEFTVTVGTLFERSHIPLHKWLLAVYLLCSSKKGISSHQLHRMLGITYRSAWFMTHRIRAAMRDSVFVKKLGGLGKIVEADETFWGNIEKKKPGARGYQHKMKIFSLVERGGDVRSFRVPTVKGSTLEPILKKQVKKNTHVITDDMGAYQGLKKTFDRHDVVRHSRGEYVRGFIYTNTIENFFSILKRGLVGIYQHVGEQHLKRYVGEFDFWYNYRKVSDTERSVRALKGIVGKRLYYSMD